MEPCCLPVADATEEDSKRSGGPFQTHRGNAKFSLLYFPFFSIAFCLLIEGKSEFLIIGGRRLREQGSSFYSIIDPWFFFSALKARRHFTVDTGRRYHSGEIRISLNLLTDRYRPIDLLICSLKSNAYRSFRPI